jgi:hypothetical protein
VTPCLLHLLAQKITSKTLLGTSHSWMYLVIGADLDQHKDCPTFTTVGSRTRINWCRIAGITSFISDKCWLWPNDGERGTETAKDFDLISERFVGLIHTIRRSRTETVEHEGDLREISHKPKKNSQEQRCVRTLSSEAAINRMWLTTNNQNWVLGSTYRGIYTRNNPPIWVWTREENEGAKYVKRL